MALVGRWLAIKCFKHDGLPHRYWDRGFVVENNDDYLVVATKKAKVIEANGRRWYTKEPAVTIFSKKEWWNVICMIKQDGICYYCNIASPSIIEGGTVKYIDYDLDVKLFPDKKIRLLDQKEYLHHKEKYSYPDDLDQVLNLTNNKVIDMMKNNVFPFSDHKITDFFNRYLESTNKENE